jgi:hypothetical protein
MHEGLQIRNCRCQIVSSNFISLVAPEQYAIIDQGMRQATVASPVRPLSYEEQFGKAFQRARLELRASMAVVAQR